MDFTALPATSLLQNFKTTQLEMVKAIPSAGYRIENPAERFDWFGPEKG